MNIEKLAELAAALPDTHKANAVALVERMGAVIEGIGDEGVKWRMPTAKLMQAVSDRSKAPKGAGIGDIIVGEKILKKPQRVIVLKSFMSRQYWSPNQNEEKMLCSSPDGVLGYIGKQCTSCPHQVFDEVAKKTECNKLKSFILITEDLSEIFALNFAKTSYKVGDAWEKNLKKAGVMPYRRVYGLTSTGSKQYKGVETLDIELYDDEKRDTTEAILPFVKELFEQVGADRKEMLVHFHKMVNSRMQDPALLADSSGGSDSEVVLIGNDSEPTETAAEKTAAPKSSMAKKYSA